MSLSQLHADLVTEYEELRTQLRAAQQARKPGEPTPKAVWSLSSTLSVRSDRIHQTERALDAAGISYDRWVPVRTRTRKTKTGPRFADVLAAAAAK